MAKLPLSIAGPYPSERRAERRLVMLLQANEVSLSEHPRIAERWNGWHVVLLFPSPRRARKI